MRPHAYRITATVFLIGTLGGCAREAAPSGQASPAPVVTSATASVAPSPSVALQEPHTFVFSAKGTAAVTSVTYVLDGHKTTVKSVKLPWRKVTDVPADGRRHTWSLTVNLRSGEVELFGLVDGEVIGTASKVGSGRGSAEVSGDFRG